MQRGESSLESAWSWWIAAIGVVIGALSFGAATSVPILLKPLSHQWGTGASTLAMVHTSTMFGAAVGGLVLGRMLDWIGFFRIAVFAALATCFGLLVVASAESISTLHLVYGLLIGGIGQGAFFSPLTAAVSQWFDRRRAMAVAIAASGQSVGGLVVPPLMRWCVERIGWRATLAWYGIGAGAVLLACAFAFRHTPPIDAAGPDHQKVTEVKRFGATSTFLMLGAGMALSNHATFIVVAHLTAFGEERGFPPAAAAALVSMLLGVTLLSRLIVGQLSARWGSYNVLLAMSTLLAMGMAGLAFADGPVGVGLGAVTIGLAFGGYLPGYAILVRALFPAAEAGRRISEIYFFAFIAAGIGSWTGGWTRDLTGGYAVPFWIAAASAMAGAATLLSWRSRLHGRAV